MPDTITVTGLIATPITHTVTSDGLEISSFRLVSHHRRFDRDTRSWVDGDTNWFSITAFRQLAANLHASLEKGQRVVVTGRLRVREWRDGEKSGRDVEIIADALGPDLAWGTAEYTKTPRAAAATQGAPQVAEAPTAADADAAGFPAESELAEALPF
ncbi:single-stranded DNA-binding protein [Salinibacterium sp. ZJ77]|uniref:single-stranded DNA-binding protein n=1 Tax=Salinibacterium sp. ZJ77 TaxID=2708337 RepID=UPI0014230672|nr:single-stranded DNA-binding protein [Salinibacterium sp. ZJ77]